MRARLLWSWLLAARNDHYQGSPEERLSTSLRVLVQGTEEHELKDTSEILVVDWNSELPFSAGQCNAPFRTLLRGALFESRVPIRFVVVPPAVASEHCRETLCEVHALNVAARHARGEMLLRIDQDTLIGRPVFQWMQNLKFSPFLSVYLRQWWWCGRRDSFAEHYDLMVADPMGFLDRHGQSIQKWGWPKPEYGGNYSRNGRGGVGIFGVPRAVWFATGGLDETMTAWGHMEVEFQRRIRGHAKVLNLDDVLPSGGVDQAVYHLNHPRSVGGPDGMRQENAEPQPLPLKQLPAEDARRSARPWGLRDASSDLHQVSCISGGCYVLDATPLNALEPGRRFACKWSPRSGSRVAQGQVSVELKRQYVLITC